MPIDQYEHSFEHLATTELPQYMATLDHAMKQQISMSEFAIDGVGIAALTQRFGLEADFPGCYVCLNKTNRYTSAYQKTFCKG